MSRVYLFLFGTTICHSSVSTCGVQVLGTNPGGGGRAFLVSGSAGASLGFTLEEEKERGVSGGFALLAGATDACWGAFGSCLSRTVGAGSGGFAGMTIVDACWSGFFGSAIRFLVGLSSSKSNPTGRKGA